MSPELWSKAGDAVKLWLEILVSAGTVVTTLWLGVKRIWKSSVKKHFEQIKEMLESINMHAGEIKGLKEDIEKANHQLHPNGGSSLADKLNKLVESGHYMKENQLAERKLSPIAMACTDSKGRLIFANLAWLKLAGFNSEEEAMGDGWRRSIHPEDKERVSAEWKHAVENQTNAVIQFRKVNLMTGEVFSVESKTTIIRDTKGEIIEYYSTQRIIGRIE